MTDSRKVAKPAQIFLSDNIRCLRKRMKISQEELANLVGLNRGNIASYEKGTAEPKICNLLKLAHVFQVSILDLTKRNLKEEVPTAASVLTSEEQHLLNRFHLQAQELQHVVDGINSCHCYKKKTLSNSTDSHHLALMANFEQLHEVTRAMLKSHRELLNFIQQKMPQEHLPQA